MPDVQNPQAAVLQWFDRSLPTKRIGAGGAATGAGTTTILTYTVPGNLKAFIPGVSISAICTAVTAAVNPSLLEVWITPNGGAALRCGGVRVVETVTNLPVSNLCIPGMLLAAGDLLEVRLTINGATTTISYAVGGGINEFTA